MRQKDGLAGDTAAARNAGLAVLKWSSPASGRYPVLENRRLLKVFFGRQLRTETLCCFGDLLHVGLMGRNRFGYLS